MNWTQSNLIIANVAIIGFIISNSMVLLFFSFIWFILAIISFNMEERLRRAEFDLKMKKMRLDHEKYVSLFKEIMKIKKAMEKSKKKKGVRT